MIFAFIALSVVVLMNYYVFKGLISLLELPDFWINILKFSVLLMCVLELCFIAFFRYKNYPDILYTLGAALFGVSFMLFCAAIVFDIFYVGVAKLPFEADRRMFLRKFLTISSLVLISAYVLRGFWGGMRKPRMKKISINIKNLPHEVNVVQMTDIHVGRILGKEFLEDLVHRTNELKPDFVAITGDLVDFELDMIKEDLKVLTKLKSTHGTFFVAGNHEYYHGVEEILHFLESIDIHVLTNSSKTLDGFNISGVYDEAAFRMNHPLKPNLDEALKHTDKNLPTILLAHQPKFIENFKNDTPVDLVLSGHTHGGQIFPFGFLVKLAQPYLYGLYEHNKHTKIYVSSGAGYWGPPIRFLAPSEIVNIKLKPKLT